MGDRARGRLFGRGRFFGVVPMIRMTTFKSIVAAGVIAAATLTATDADALPFTERHVRDLRSYNYNATGSGTGQCARDAGPISTRSPAIGR